MNIYRHTFYVSCPVDQRLIEYTLELRSNTVIMAENIVASCVIESGLHEDIADKLHTLLGGRQRIVACHGFVEIETVRP